MKRSNYLHTFLSLFLIIATISPVAALGLGDGKKHFKVGMRHEAAEEWDKASEEFAIAVSENPKNPEYRLHLTRALFNASQQYIKKGTLASKEKDYENAYISFRKAYAFDPTNELAKSEMDRMVRLQKEVLDGKSDKRNADGSVKVVPTAFKSDNAQQMPQKLEKLRDLPFPAGVDLQFIIKELARDLDLNVLFDTESFRTPNRKVNIELKNVTAARALDYIFLQEGLFFQKVGPRTIIVALQTQRQKFQQLVLRTFYLQNAAPKDIAKVVQTAIPAQPGRTQTIVLTDDATNSVTIRDTEENIKLIGKLISSLDKDRAEVVMDVSIYEVNKSDLLQFGNQLGSTGQNGTLLNIGGVGIPNINLGSSGPITTGMGIPNLASLGFALGLPVSNITALQSKANTKLIASTQIHAFNNEDSSARIGQRVPVQTAQISNGNFNSGANNTNNNNGFLSNVINYEQVGLTLKFKPLVFPNQDVQVAMEIESKDVAGASSLTPTFTERTIKGTARVQNNKTLLLASVAQGVETKSRSGLPLIGLIPIIGRLFTAPVNDNRQVDIVIAVTPRVIRAPAILPEDEIERPTGSLAVPTSNSLEAMIIDEEREEMLALARKTPSNVTVQLPDQPADAPTYVRADASQGTAVAKSDPAIPSLVPIDSSVKSLQLTRTSNIVDPGTVIGETVAAPAADLALTGEFRQMKTGERAKFAISMTGTSSFRSAVLGLQFDQSKLAVRAVTLGDVFGAAENTPAMPFLNQNGKMFISLTAKEGIQTLAAGTLVVFEVEALADGEPTIAFVTDVLNLMTTDGKNFAIKVN
ncbi:MAG TPA: secretin N-terminal domain-containing protein [Pyrinomonadaceae bacterium]|nr:hypothetical protein [Chloracidobacterium sp.]MBP9934450.1 hypothetical protein [Pyrinomonadaceae bacterium]MBK7802567.1 hypothetical protein [Chloracidobacterium sp.]MBK9437422.1 hypothetical protein [Chloracidobacterium sp.]MBL0240092.1 hypothetical protein [Chloracidobacterium sp.]